MTTELEQLEKQETEETTGGQSVPTIVPEVSPIDTVKQLMQAAGINTSSISGLFTNQKEPLQDLHVIKTWVPVNEKGEIDQNVVRFVTRVMNPFQLSVLQTMIRELIGDKHDLKDWPYDGGYDGEDPQSGFLLLYFFNQYLINMIPFEGRRVLEQTEGLRARKQSEEQGLDLSKTKSAKGFLLGEKSTV